MKTVEDKVTILIRLRAGELERFFQSVLWKKQQHLYQVIV